MIVKLKPVLKSYLWGGKKLKSEWNKSGEEVLSESWELSFHKDGPSEIVGGEHAGKLLRDAATADDWGSNCKHFEFFPVLTKIIDAAQPLSVQVHPSDEYALANEGQYGKTEMWYILDAEEGAFLYLGFNRDVTPEQFSAAVKDGTVCDCLNRVPVKAGDTYFIPSGTVHAIGAGITLFEVQQNSSLTYRVYDFGRVDKNGVPRELHVEKAKKVTNFNKLQVPSPERGELLGKCKYFSTYRLSGERLLGNDESFVCVTVFEGAFKLGSLSLEKGETAFMSAGEHALISGNGQYAVILVEKE